MQAQQPDITYAPPECSADSELVLAWQRNKDGKALEVLIKQNLPKIRYWAKKNVRTNTEDLVSEAVVALIEAANKFSPETSPIPFTLQASPAMHGAVLRASARMKAAVFVPERQIRDALAGRMAADKREQVIAAIDTRPMDDVDTAALSVPASEQALLEDERQETCRRAIASALQELTYEENEIVQHHILQDDLDFDELASRLSITAQRVRNLEKRALIKMRNALLRDGFLMTDIQ